MIGIVVATALALQDPTTPPSDAPLSPEAQALIAPVLEAMAAERARQAALPPPADDRERLERMGVLDQAGRRVLAGVNLHVLPADQIPAARKAMWAPVAEADRENAAALVAMTPPEGWFYRSVWGEKASSAAFHIVQHSDLALWRRFVPVLEPLVATGEVEGQSYAMMYDRLALNEGRPQRYGTQMTCRNGVWAIDTLEDPDNVEARRKAMDFPWTLEEYKAHFATYPPCT
jgi:hypothetical protein